MLDYCLPRQRRRRRGCRPNGCRCPSRGNVRFAISHSKSGNMVNFSINTCLSNIVIEGARWRRV